ncbi:Fibrous sheath-interacting protein 2 [Tupaia chinensis]|uniref:Fibrous sheath-interacting protein 2 n=1 Tax=Tupaia chinensis TaxID=246437 RepID=L9LA75_TUPCH|nr:Fibrous sheath-interacting protein 2 [Tupaia chinensis]
MELYLSSCSKAANIAATKTATSSLAANSQQCGDLFRPSYGFNLTDPYCRLLENQYKSLHDPHLRAYYKRKDVLRRLKKGGYITSNNKEMLAKQLHKLQEHNQISEHLDIMQFQNWLLQEGTQSIKDQERLIRHRYLDMINRELEQLERKAEEQRLLRMDREERQQREHTRRKLSLRRKIEEEWKTKEMLLLTKIGEDVKREQRIEEQRRRNREESDRKKKTKSYDDTKLVYAVDDLKTYKGAYGHEVNTVKLTQNSSKNVTKKSSITYQPDAQDNNGIEQKKDEVITKNSSTFNDRGDTNMSARESIVSAQTSPTKNFPRPSVSLLNLNRPKEEVTSEELNSIIQNVMTWVVATVTSILYPAITKYEERLRNHTYPVSDDSVLSSDSSSFCSTCSEEFTYGSYTTAATKTFHAEPCAFSVDVSVRRPTTPLRASAHMERTVVGKTYHKTGQSITSGLKYNKANLIYSYPKVRSCKSDSQLLASVETGTKKSKDATTETDGLGSPLFYDKKAKAMEEIKNLKNVFVNFKCHLKEETQLILESIFQETMSDLTQAIPSLSSVTAEVFVDQSEPEKEDLLSNADICSVASEIVDNMLEKLECAVEKKCVEIFSQEDLSDDGMPSVTTSGEGLILPNEKVLKDSPPYTLEPMCEIAEDMVHTILEKLMTLTSCQQNKLPHFEDTGKLYHQQNKTDPAYRCLQRDGEKQSSSKPNASNLIVKEEIQHLITNIFSQSSLLGYIEDAVSTILGYVQTELNNERLIASEETVVLLRLLDDIFTELHQEPVKAGVQKSKRPKLRDPLDIEEKYRVIGTRFSQEPRSRRPFPPINVPGMVLYSEDDSEEIEKIVENVLDSSFKDEKAKLQQQIPENWFKKRNNCFEYKRNIKPPTKPASQNKVAFHDWGLKTELPSNNEDIFMEKPCLSKDIPVFNQDQKHQIQKASENIIKSILRELLKDLSSVPPDHSDSRTGKEASVHVSEKLSHRECMYQMFSRSEISTVAQEITEAVLNILHKASSFISNTTKSSMSSSVHQTSLDNSVSPHMFKEAPNKKPLKIWFDSEKKMKYLSSVNVEPENSSWLNSGESEPKPVDHIGDKIIHTIFKRLKSFVCPKLQMDFKSSLDKQSSLQSQLSTYTTKVVNIVLHAIQNELELNKEKLNLVADHTKSLTGKGLFVNADKKLESFVTNLNDESISSPLLTFICDLLSNGHADQRNILPPEDKPMSATSCESDNIDKQKILLNKQDKKSFLKLLATPCTIHSVINRNDLKENAKLQVLDRIGETLHEMLSKLIGTHPHSQPHCCQQDREKMKEDQELAVALQSNIQLISKTILEYILAKLCSIDTDTSFVSSGFNAVSEFLDIDSLSYDSIIEEMAKCTNMISNIVSRMIQDGNTEVTKNKAKNIVPITARTENTKGMHSNKLKSVASDILSMVFDKLEGFANGNLETLGVSNDGNKKSDKMDWECGSTSVSTGTHEEPLQSALFMHAKKVSSAILKAIHTELNMNSPDLRTNIKNPPPETQMLKNIVNLILDAISSDIFNETESEGSGIETYRYRPTYGNFLPGGAESDSFLEDDGNTEKEFIGETTPIIEETKTNSLKQRVLERTLNKIEMKLKEPHKSPIIPIVRNILNEIFQSTLISQLNVLPLSHSHFSVTPHNPDAQTSLQFMNKIMDPLVSDTDVTIVADNVVKIVFHKLYSAAVTERNVSENRQKTITFSANVSFHEQTYQGKSSATVLDRNPWTHQSRFSVDKQSKINVVEDIIQAILTNLETFTTCKVKSFFCPQVNITVPMAVTSEQDKSPLSKEPLSANDTYSDEQFTCYPVDHNSSGETNLLCQRSFSKLNTYAKVVARKILEGIKHELDKEREKPSLTQNVVVSESIASRIVETVLDAVSCKSKCDKNNSDKEFDAYQQEDIIEKLVNKREYRKILQFQIQDTIEDILCDIYKKTLYQNNLSFATPTLKCSITGKHSEANSEMFIKGANKFILKPSVPKSDVTLISSDIVDIVLHSLHSAVMLGINTKDSTFARLPQTSCEMFPKAECQQSKNKIKTECVPCSRSHKSAYSANNQITVVEKEDAKKFAPDPCEENANFITKTIFSRLESFATERIDSLITLDFQPKEKSFVSPVLENYKPDDTAFHDSSQVESDINVLKISTTETILSQEFTDSTFASYREKLGSTIHLSPASLKEYADIISSAILKLIKNDLDLEIQKRYPFPSSIAFQENIIVSEIINGILKILHDKRSVKEISVYSKENPNFSQLTASNEILAECREKENIELSLFSKCPLGQNQMTMAKESQRVVLEKIFMRNGESKQKERTELHSAVEKLLNKLHQRVMEIMCQLPQFDEFHHFTSNSKIKTSDVPQNLVFQSHINSVANDIVESVLGKMYSVVEMSLYKNNKSRGETETSDDNDALPINTSYSGGTNQTEKRSNPSRCVISQVYADSQNVSVLEDNICQYSPLQVGKDLVQIVLTKITYFISLHLKECLSSEGCSDELQQLRLYSSKVSPKSSPRLGFKTSLKAKSKSTPLPKFRTKPHIGPSGARVKSKTKFGLGEKTLRETQSKIAIGLPHVLSIGDAKNLLEKRLPTSELKTYAKDIISIILEIILKEFEKVKQTREMANIKALPSDQIMAAGKMVSSVLQKLYAMNNHNMAHSTKFSYLNDLKLSQGNKDSGSLAKQQACFYLENVSSQLEQIFPKEGIFKKMFDKWQTESNDMENEKCKLLMIAENVLTEISIKAKELEYSLSLLNLPPLEDYKSRFYNHFKGVSPRAKNTKAQINMFGREIVEMLFEKLQLCFLSQMPTPDSKEALANKKEHLSAKSKYGFPNKQSLRSLPICNTKTNEQTSMSSSNHVVRDIVERVLNMLESFVDLQFKHISKYEFSEIVKLPIENLFPVQQRLLSKKMLPKLQPLKNFADESKSSTTISKDNIQSTLLQAHSFHSELLTYAVTIVNDMLGVIKNKLDKEISQMEPSSISILKENTVASEIIGTLMDQCTNFSESLIKNLPKESTFPGTENAYIVNQVELASKIKMPTSKSKEASLGNNPQQVNVDGLVFYAEEDIKAKYRVPANFSSYIRSSLEDTIKISEPMEMPDSETISPCSRNKIRDHSPKKSNFGHVDEAMRGNNFLPEGSVLQKMFKKANDSTEASLQQVMSFIEMGKGENPRVFHYETIKPRVEPNQIQTAVSPLKICLAAENIVNTVLSNYGFPSQPHTNESTETMKPFFIPKQNTLSEISGGEKNEKNLLRIWDKKINCISEEENGNPEDSRGNVSLLQKWQNKKYSKKKKIETLKEVEVIAFADHELGPNEIHLVARHVTTSVVTYFKNFKTRVSIEEKISIVSTLSRTKCESKQTLRSIYNNSLIYQFCEHLTESVICHLISSISDGTRESKEQEKARKIQDVAFNKIISIHSHKFESRSISVGELALSISEIIVEILFNSKIIEMNIAQKMVSIKAKYIYCPGVASADFDDLFQDLLIGVIHVLSKEIGITHHFENNVRNKSFSIIRSNSESISNQTNTMKIQEVYRDQESSIHQTDQLAQKNKLSYLACKLDTLAGSLESRESKEVVNKVFNIVLDLFSPDECSNGALDSGQIAKTFFSSPNNQQNNSILRNNVGLSPKSVFLLNVVCEKLVRTLLEKFTSTMFLDNGPFSDEISSEDCQLLKILQSIKDGDFDYCKGATDCEQLQGDYTSGLLENLPEIDQDLLSSDTMLATISHRLVKSLMDKLSQSIQQAPESPPFANGHLNPRTREIQSSSTKVKWPELIELGQGKGSLEIMSCNSNSLTGSLNNPNIVSSRMQAPFGTQYTIKSSVSDLKRQTTKERNTITIHNKLHQRGMNAGVYSATFLEEIISELFFNLSTSLWGKNKNITESYLNDMNTLLVNKVVNEFNDAKVTVLRNSEERLCFPTVHKDTISKIVNSVYYDVLQQYELEMTRGNNLSCDNTPIAGQITSSILFEILDYQLPSCFREKLMPHSYYPLNAKTILQKLQNNLRKFTLQPWSSTGYSTMLSHSFLENIIKRLLSQLIPQPSKASYLEKNYVMSSDFNEMSTCIISKVMSAISKHNIWFTIYDSQYLYTGQNLEKMVDSVYSNILKMSDSLLSIQKSIVSRSPIIVEQIASFIIQEIIENHLHPFLCGESLPRPRTPLDEVSNMVKQVLREAIESNRSHTLSPLCIYPDIFVREIVARLLSKIFNPKHNTEVELENMTQKIVNSINNHLDKAKILTLCEREESFPSVDTDIVNELVSSVYRNVLKQHGLDPDVDQESEDTDIFVENITNLIIAAISDYLLHPLFSGDLQTSSCSISTADNIVQEILSNIRKSTTPSQILPPYNTLLPYTFLEDMIRILLSRFFPSASSMLPNIESPRDRPRGNFNEIASNLISDIRMKISQHEIRFSKDEEETNFVYSEDDAQHLVDSVFQNILQNSESQESVEQDITSSNDVLIDRIAGFIIKHICQQHLQPFVDRKSLPSSPYTYLDDERRQLFYTSVYSSSFLEDVVSGVLSKIFHRVIGIVQTNTVKDSEDELFDAAEKLIHLITEEFSKAQVSIIDNAEEQLHLPPVEQEKVKKIIDMVYSKILQEYEMEIMPQKYFLNDPKTLASRVTKIILAEIFDFQIDPDLIANLPCKSYSKLSANVLIKRVQYGISKSRFRRQASTTYTTMLSHTHLEKIVTQLMSQMSPLASSMEHPDTPQSDLSNTVIKLINEIMSIISKHAICIVKQGNGKQSMISEKDIQSMADSIYADLSCSDLYQSLMKDKKAISNIPVSKIASFIIKEIFNHHIQSFLSGDKSLLSAPADQNYKHKPTDPKQRELSFIVNSAIFLEEVISQLLCKIFYAFTHNVLAAENPDRAKAKITGIVTTLVKSIVLEFTTSEILVAENFDENLCFSERYQEMVQNTVNPIYEKILDEYKSLIQVYRVIQNDTIRFGRKIYNLLLEEIYDYQVQSLVSGELESSSFSSPRADNIIRNVLTILLKDSHSLPSCITVLPRSLLEDMVYKLLVHIFPSTDTETELKEEEVIPDHECVDAVSTLTDEIIKEISEHEIRLATAEENAGSIQLEAIENLVDSICSNIWQKSEFQAEVQKNANKKESSFLSKIAGFIMKEIMDHHLQPFLHGEESLSSDLPDTGHDTVLAESVNKKTQSSLYSATFLEDVIVDLVHKFCSLPTITEHSKKNEMPEPDIVGLAITFANSLIKEFSKSEIKVLPNAEEMFSFPPVDKDTVDKISNFVYDQFIGKYEPNDIRKDNKSNFVIEMIAALAQKAISAFKIQPLFSGDWSSTFFSFLDPENITQRVQHLPQKTSTKINRYLRGNELTLPENLYKNNSLTLDEKNAMDLLKIDRSAVSGNKSFKSKGTSMKKGNIQDPILTSITTIMKSNVTNQLTGSTSGAANKKEDENKAEIYIQNCSENVLKLTAPTAGVKSKDTQESDFSKTLTNNETEKKTKLSLKDKEDQGGKIHEHFSVVTDDTEFEKEVLRGNFEIDDDKKIDNTKDLFKKEDKPFQLSSLKFKVKNMEDATEKSLKVVTQKPNNEKRNVPAQIDTVEEQSSDYECVQNVIENIYDNILEISSDQESADFSKSRYSKSLSEDKDLNVIQETGKDSIQPIAKNDLFASINKNVHAEEKKIEKEEEREKKEEKEKEKENVKEKENKSLSCKADHPQYPPESKVGIFPAKLLEDVITELVNKLIFSSSSKAQTYHTCTNVDDELNQSELYDTAMKLIDSLLKEFSDAQIKVFRPEKGNQCFPPVETMSSVPKAPSKYKQTIADEASSSIKIKTEDKISHVHKMPKKPFFLEKVPSFDKSLVNKVVHSSICSILKEYRSQYSICKNINSNRGNLARRLTSAVINEIFEHQLNLIFGNEIPAAACLPLESKDFVKKVKKVAQTTNKECQTSSPYTIILPHTFLEDVISALISKIFSTICNSKAEASENNVFTELDFFQMKLVNTVEAEIAKDKDMIVQYVESLHPNDEEIIQLVVQSIYNNLLPQFGSQESIQNCITSGCRILSETIVDLVLREVAGNQLQNYFCGELTPCQCAEVDSVVENILKDVTQTTHVSPPQPPQAHKLPYNVIEEISVKFLSKLLSRFPKVQNEETKSLEEGMQKITSKILNSVQEFISKSNIKLIPSAKESSNIPVGDNATIEKVVNSVYTSILKHSGSYTSVFKDLMSKSNVLSDIIGFLMVKEISNSEFEPQVEEEVSSSELVLEAVKIMEKVVKIIDEFKSQEKFPSKKGSMLDVNFLEEALALFLSKLVRLPSGSKKDAKNLSKSELNKIASQLTKSVTAEISRSNITLVAADSEEHFLYLENKEMISKVVDSVYSNILQQSGTYRELYDDIKHTNIVFPEKVAGLIINEISGFSLDTVISENSNANQYDLDINRIVQKAQEHAVEKIPDFYKELDQDSFEEETPVKIVPHLGKKPIKIDPSIISEHLAVISVKTQPLEKLKIECLKRTGHSIAELRRASISGKSYSSHSSTTERKKRERRISLNKTGRLDVKPFEAVGRNSFQNIRMPDITKVELLKDVRSKKDLIIRLVAHDIEQEDLESNIDEGIISEDEEIVIGEIVAQEEILEVEEDQMKETQKPIKRKAVSPKQTLSTSSLKKFLSLSKCCQPTSSANIESIEVTTNQKIESKEKDIERAVSEIDVTTIKSLTLTNFSQEKKTQCKFITIYEGPKNVLNSAQCSKEVISKTPKPGISKQGSKMLAKVSSALSKVFSRSNTSISKSSSPPQQDEC